MSVTAVFTTPDLLYQVLAFSPGVSYVLRLFLESCQHMPRVGLRATALDIACRQGDLHLVQQLQDRPCTTKAMDWAAANGHLDVVAFLHQHRSEGCTVDAIDRAAQRGHADVVEFLLTHRPVFSPNALVWAAAHGHVSVLRALLNANPTCEWNYEHAMARAIENGHDNAVTFIRSTLSNRRPVVVAIADESVKEGFISSLPRRLM
ncbi:hypothetical protein H257_10633 [Aphanomyces astaci]|uniref:Uncharacterized protein n=1 Tax=Aphanomyces astaci TaxID=112090 RepID=W4G6X3_APHAT|nr:hypothetical protein H257_10633 [Aphanomyces astaci]ETV75031.1 hypothetical protein H257_10633 [Aphanomyces astaci]|eukprot:XP_009835535.1 hypothetical protein H257_10633 [Aphanomyces astaci]